MAKQSFFKNIGIAIILNILVKPASLLLENVVQDRVGHAVWGQYAAASALCFLAGMLADLGIGAFATQQYASNPEELRKHFPHLWGIKLALILFFPFIIITFAWLKGDSLYQLVFIFCVALITSLTQASEFLRFYIRALQDFKIDSYLSVLEKVLYVVGMSFLLYIGLSIETFIGLRIAIWIVTFATVYYFLVQIIGFHLPKIHFSKVIPTLRGSIVFSLLTILASVNEKIDQVLLKELVNETETGLYAGAYRWLDAVLMYLWIVLPFFYARFAYLKDNYQEQQNLLQIGQVVTAIPLLFVSVFVFFYPEKLLFLFSHSQGAEIERMSQCLQILFVGCGIYAIFSIFDNVMTSTGYTKQVNIVLVLCIIQNIALNLLFIPKYGAIASAYATITSYLTMGIGYIVIMEKYMQIKVPYQQLFKLLGVTLLLILTFYSFKQIGVIWWLNVGISFVIYVVVCLFLGFVPRELLRKLRRN